MLTVVAAAMAILLASGPGRASPAPAASKQATPAFVGASAERIFLSPMEQDEAAMRGLLPKGTRSIIRTKGALSHGDWRWDDQGVPRGKLTVRVDPSRQTLSVFRGSHEIGTALIVYGAVGKETPRGRLPIIGKTRDHHSRTYDAPMPYSLWLTTDGVAIHGSDVAVGRASNGCIGVPVPFAAKLFAAARKGDVIEVLS